MTQWTLQPVAAPIVIGLIAAALLGLFFLRPAFQSATPRRRGVLIGIRLLATLMLVTALVRPGCVRKIEKQQSAVLLLMADLSRSMQLPHQSQKVTRWDALRKIVADESDRLRALNEKNIKIEVLGFDGTTHSIEFDNGEIALPDMPEGGTTDIGSSLDEALRGLRSQRLAGVIMLSDGVQNEANPQVDLEQAVRQLIQTQTPLYPIAFGEEAGAGQFADVSIENMADQFSVFVKNKLVIKATLRTRGYVNRQIPVRLLLENAAGEQSIVHTELVDIDKEQTQQQLNIPLIPQEPGEYKLILQADEQPSEPVTRNNRLPAFLTVYDGGLRVLYLYGSISPEQRYLKTSIGASPDIQFDFFPINPRNRDGWPLNRPDLFDPEKYDVFIFSDVDSRALYQKDTQEKNFAALLQAIDAGKGLMMIGGAHSFGPGLYQRTPLADVLPLVMDDFEKQEFDAPLMKAFHLDGPLRIRPVENHFLTAFNDLEGQPIWDVLPELPGANRFKDVRPTSRILLETDAGDPILIADNSGGRVLAMAADSTWMWYTHDQQDFHQRFWRQVVLWLAGRDGLNQGNVWIELSQRRFTEGVPVAFTAGAREPTGQPIPNANFQFTLVHPDGNTSSLLSTQRTGVIQGQVDPKQLTGPGSYRIELLATVESTTPESTTLESRVLGKTSAEFILFDQDKEKANPAADPALLNRIAARTREFGGRSVPPEEFGSLLDEISDRPLDLKIEVPQSWKLGDTLVDGLLFVLAMVSLLTGEWFLRKKWGMV